MTIDPQRYRRSRGKGTGGPVMLNIRLRKLRGKAPTAVEVREVLRTIADTGVCPAGWQFAAIDWRNPRHASTAWRSGVQSDLENFGAVLQTTLRQARIAIVRPETRELQRGVHALDPLDSPSA